MFLLKVLLFILFVKYYVMSQVCFETRSYIETYEEPCLVFCSVKTRTAVNITSRTVQRYENVTVNVCCEGYVEDYSHEGNGLFCIPICNPSCQGGYCRRPNECACEAGYALDPLNPHICKPLCLKDCDISYCISTKTPQCFLNESELLKPICTEPCVNGNCIAPEVCECLPGYHKTSENVCEPYIFSCDHGKSTNPETRDCDVGWQWLSGSCQPVCVDCNFGTCTSPGQCECNPGYVETDKNQCEPHCSDGCPNGKCVMPEFCACNPGWYKIRDEDNCVAHCDMNCDNGDCIAPNVCECHIGYQLDADKENPRCVLIRKGCDGSSFDTCKCEPQYEVRYTTEDGADCDCFGFCSVLGKECNKSICLYKGTAVKNISVEVEKNTVLSNLNTSPHQKFDVLPILPNTATKNSEDIPVSHDALKTTKTLALPAHWIFGIVAVAVLIVLLILGLIMKTKCLKSPISGTPGIIKLSMIDLF